MSLNWYSIYSIITRLPSWSLIHKRKLTYYCLGTRLDAPAEASLSPLQIPTGVACLSFYIHYHVDMCVMQAICSTHCYLVLYCIVL